MDDNGLSIDSAGNEEDPGEEVQWNLHDLQESGRQGTPAS